MARFEVEGRIRARDDASRQVRAVERALEENAEAVDRLQREFDAGDRSARDFVRGMERLDREAESLDRQMRGLGDQTDRTRGAMGGLGGFLRDRLVVDIGTVIEGVRALGRGFASMVNSAAEAEAVQNRLAESLRGTEGAGSGLIRQLNAQAEAFERNTRFTQEAVTGQQAFLAELGVAPEQLQLATQATVDLAESFDFSLNEAARNVGRTVGGFAGELGEIIPELKEFDASALQAGEGIRFLAEEFEGAASAAADDLQVRLANLREEVSDLGQSFAEGVLQGTEISAGLESLAESAREAEQGTRDAGRGVGVLVDSSFELVDSLRSTGTNLDFVVTGIPTLVRAIGEWQRVTQEQARATELLDDQNRLLLERMGVIESSVGGAAETFVLFGGEIRRVSEITAGLLRTMGDLGEAASDAAEGVDETTDSFESMAEAQSDVVARSDRLLGFLDQIGVRLERNLRAEIERTNERMADLHDEFLRGEITGRDWARIQEEGARRIERLRERLTGANEEVGRSEAAFSQASESASRFGQATERNIVSIERATGSVRRLRTEVQGARFDFDALAEAEGRAAAVQGALASGGTLTQGGTRVRLPNGGSRLVTAPGFGSTSRRESRFIPGVSTVV